MSDLSILQSLVKSMAGRDVLVIGDMILDRFVYGDVDRISPEGPIPVLSVKREAVMLGGSGNVLTNLHGLGIKATAIGIAGKDDNAGTLRALLQSNGSDPALIMEAEDRPTTIKTRFLAGHQHLLRTDYERSAPIPAAIEGRIIDALEKQAASAQAIVLSDYGKGVLTAKVIAAALAAAGKSGIPVLVDPKGTDFSIYKGADIVTPNRKELRDATAMPTESDEDILSAGRHLLKTSGIRSVVATRSQDGMTILADMNAEPVHLKTRALEVFDVSGAGDTVIATLAAALAAGGSLIDAAMMANAAAGIVVGKVGTAPIRSDELLKILAESKEQPGFQAPLCAWDEAAEHIARWRAQGLKIGFTNGCFDILHAGHVTYLNQARSRCDRLVVAINADASVKRLKGPDRPVNDQDARARVLGALGSVDMVVLFGEDPVEKDNPLAVIRKLTPDLLVKGADYTVETVIGADYVMSTGGEVWLAPLEDGKSTTATIKKLKGVA